jgi:chemotaxis protein CheC
MERWTVGAITLTLKSVRQSPVEEVCSALGISDELLTMVVMRLQGDLGGGMVLTFDENDGRRLAATLAGCPVSTDPNWNDLEISALSETGNILGCAYLNALTEFSDTPLLPSPPYFLQDYGVSILEPLLVEQAVRCDTVLICEIGFRWANQEPAWRLLFVPTEEMRHNWEEMALQAKGEDGFRD